MEWQSCEGPTPTIAGRSRSAAPPSALASACEAHLRYLEQKHYGATTLGVRRVHLRLFCSWASTRGVATLQSLTPAVVDAYQRYLLDYRQRTGQPLSLLSQHARLTHLRVFGAWLVRQGALPRNPVAGLELPRVGHRLPAVLSAGEVERILAQPALRSRVGLRDRALLETFYATGIRRTELIRLTLADLDRERGLLVIRQGKGRRDRVVPLGERALAWMTRYLVEARPDWARPDAPQIYLTTRGTPFHPNHLSALVRGYVEAAQLGKRGACHLFRHTMATLMLEGGADIRYIQEMLGHADLTSTQLYTHVAIGQLRAVHAATHPAARLPRQRRRRSRRRTPHLPHRTPWVRRFARSG